MANLQAIAAVEGEKGMVVVVKREEKSVAFSQREKEIKEIVEWEENARLAQMKDAEMLKARLGAVKLRLAVGKATAEAVLDYVNMVVQAEMQHAALLVKANEVLAKAAEIETGSAKESTMLIGSSRMANIHEDFARYVKTDVLPVAQSFTASYVQFAKTSLGDCNSVLMNIEKQETLTKQKYEQFIASWGSVRLSYGSECDANDQYSSNNNGNGSNSSNDGSGNGGYIPMKKSEDTWILLREFAISFNELNNCMIKNEDMIVKIMEQLQTMETKRTEILKQVYTMYLAAEVDRNSRFNLLFNEQQTVTKSIDSEKDKQVLLQSLFINDTAAFNEEQHRIRNPQKLLPCIANEMSSIEVVMHGEMERQSTLLKHWKPVKCTLTRQGFLHMFENGIRTTEVYLGGCTFKVRPELGSNIFEILEPSRGLFKSSVAHILKASSEESLVDWMVALKNIASKLR